MTNQKGEGTFKSGDIWTGERYEDEPDMAAHIVRDWEITFSRGKPGSWSLLHSTQNEKKTSCGIPITIDWDYDSDLSIDDIECKKCLKILSSLRKSIRV